MRVVFLFLRLHSCSDVAAALGVGVSTPGQLARLGRHLGVCPRLLLSTSHPKISGGW